MTSVLNTSDSGRMSVFVRANGLFDDWFRYNPTFPPPDKNNCAASSISTANLSIKPLIVRL